MITKDTLLDIIQDSAQKEDIFVPAAISKDFDTYFPNFDGLTAFNHVRTKVCNPLSKLLKEPEFAEQYAELYGAISQQVRLKLTKLLGFEEYIKKPVNKQGESSRDLLIKFLSELNAGESWNPTRLKKWKYEEDTT